MTKASGEDPIKTPLTQPLPQISSIDARNGIIQRYSSLPVRDLLLSPEEMPWAG